MWNLLEERIALKDLDKYTWTDVSMLGQSGNLNDIELKESTYFTCLKIISESIAKCPLILKRETETGEKVAKEHYLYEKLRLRPNPYMSSIDFLKAVVATYKHEGVSGIYIVRDKNGKIKDLYPAVIEKMIIDDVGLIKSSKKNKILVEFNICGEKGKCFYKDIIILKDFTLDGINTKATKDLLKQNINTNIKSGNYLNSLFDNGLTNKLVVQMVSDIKEEKEVKKIQEKFNRLYSSNGRIFTVPAGFNLQPLNLSLADAQFEQIKRMSIQQIASSFGIKMSQLGDLKDTNNNSLEQQNISFLVDTLLIIFESIEQEMDYKLLTEKERLQGYKIRFNTNVMLRTDAKTQAEILTSYLRHGTYTINDTRKILGLESIEGASEILVASGTYKLKDLSAITLKKGGDNGGKE